MKSDFKRILAIFCAVAVISGLCGCEAVLRITPESSDDILVYSYSLEDSAPLAQSADSSDSKNPLPESSSPMPENTDNINENESNNDTSDQVSAEHSETQPPVSLQEKPEKPAETIPDYIEKYPHVVGNHLWNKNNTFYNPNVTYTNPWHEMMERQTVDGTVAIMAGDGSYKSGMYDRKSVINYAAEHWAYGDELCAEFAAICISQGGLEIKSDSSTSLFIKLITSGMGFAEFIPLNEDRTITAPEYAKPGDIMQVICPYEGLLLHSTVFCGTDENGLVRVYAHNLRDGGKYRYRSYRRCYDCNTFIEGVYFFHFFDKGETPSKLVKGLADNTRLFARQQRTLAGCEYDRQAAIAYVEENRSDCIGSEGALHTTEAFTEAGITVGYPNNSALFMQLLISGLGSAVEIDINDDNTITLPDIAKPGDVCFIMCDDESMMIGSFLIKGKDSDNLAIAYAYDRINNGKYAYELDGHCIGCGGKTSKVVLYHFNDNA